MNAKSSGMPILTNGPASDQSVIDWDFEALRLNQSFDQIVGAQSVLTSVSVRKPGAQEWFRVHPDPSWRLQTTILQIKEEGESYLISPSLRTDLWDEILPIVLFTAVSRQGEPFLWPVRLPKVDGRIDKFIETDLTAAKVAETQWVRRYWVPEIKSHKILAAKNLSDNPVWPEVGFQELLKLAFRDRFIQDINHPVVKSLRGEM
jgi:hypothetical protein